MTQDNANTTHFGFETVPEAEKAGRVQGVFNSVASKYDVMNDVMSMGIHRIWKNAMMDWLAPRGGLKLLDVAGGTGDVSFKFLKRAGHGHATVLDITEPMLIEGRKRAEADSMQDSLDWVVGDAMALPFADNTFDVYTISFGIRNVTRPQEALNEAYRVLRPGGRLMVLEFSQLPNEAMQKAYDLYSFNVIPQMGKMIANDRDSYQYLVESIRNFPDQETFHSRAFPERMCRDSLSPGKYEEPSNRPVPSETAVPRVRRDERNETFEEFAGVPLQPGEPDSAPGRDV